jgi:D-3-phosphoglycerate dehydrogenase / 2-oxoglutarate reductase
MTRVLVSSPPYPLEGTRDLLEPAGVRVEAGHRPWSGDDVVGLLTWEDVREEDLRRLPALKVIATASVGFDHIDREAARRRGVWVCNVPDYCIEEMADSTIALALALLRGVVFLDRSVRDGLWDDHAAGPIERVSESRIGVVGFGRIGRAVAAEALALGMEVWASDPQVSGEDMAVAGVTGVSLDALLAGCSLVTLHVPLTSGTTALIGERELALMPRGSYLVNTARAGLVDQGALVAALETGSLGGAAVDVLAVEPPDRDHPAPRHPRLIVTPHAAWYSPRAEREVYRRAALAVRAVLEGREPEGALVNP